MDKYEELLVKQNEEIGIRCDKCKCVFFVDAKIILVQHKDITCPDCQKVVDRDIVGKYTEVARDRMKKLYMNGGNILLPHCIYPPELD